MSYKDPPVEHQFTSENQPENRGRKKGSRSLSTIIRTLMEEKIDWDRLPVKDVSQLKNRFGSNTAWEAVVYVAMAKALNGDSRAWAWLSKSGYGDKIVHDFETGLFTTGELTIKVKGEQVGTNTEREAEPSPEPPEQSANS